MMIFFHHLRFWIRFIGAELFNAAPSDQKLSCAPTFGPDFASEYTAPSLDLGPLE
ncbi:hypothetical protein HanXRQr2_Chr15g0708411 [Helianthus annuus]|uniref:Uncharacterized protein n=1 Tax=Helianthus annuus TaxID=4232 RepID=A0A251SB98_HELAN|nr:hypothetical protein HanXRQr2_Chr15g0708411 [Helianthus annuus]